MSAKRKHRFITKRFDYRATMKAIRPALLPHLPERPNKPLLFGVSHYDHDQVRRTTNKL
jgi:hypothetical protein